MGGRGEGEQAGRRAVREEGRARATIVAWLDHSVSRILPAALPCLFCVCQVSCLLPFILPCSYSLMTCLPHLHMGSPALCPCATPSHTQCTDHAIHPVGRFPYPHAFPSRFQTPAMLHHRHLPQFPMPPPHPGIATGNIAHTLHAATRRYDDKPDQHHMDIRLTYQGGGRSPVV